MQVPVIFQFAQLLRLQAWGTSSELSATVSPDKFTRKEKRVEERN